MADPNAPGTGDNTGQNNSSSGGGDNTTKLDDGFKKEFTDYTAKWMIDIFFRLVLLAVRTYAKIDRSEIMLAIDQGHIHSKFLEYVDQTNKSVDDKLDVTETEKKFVIEPLRYFLEVKNIQMSPGAMVGISLGMVIISLGIRAHEAKKENKRILDRIIKESAEIRKEARRNYRNNNSYEPPETVSFSETPVSEPTFTVVPDPPVEEPAVTVVPVESVDAEEIPNSEIQ